MTNPGHPMQLMWGLTLWAIWFVAVYGGLSIACEIAPAAEDVTFSIINGGLIIFTLLTTVFLLWLMRRCWHAWQKATPPSRQFITAVSCCLYAASAVATIAIGLPILWLPACL